MGYHLRIESKKSASFITCRSRNSELWFVNNRSLEESILSYLAKYAEAYGAKIYAIAIEGNHIQLPAMFPNANRADFMRDFNASVTRNVQKHCSKYPGGTFWARRYSAEILPDAEDIEDYFFYTVLQPVQDGLVEDIKDYPGYNCFEDAIYGRTKTYNVIDWARYNADKRFNKKIDIADYTKVVTLKYSRIPGYEDLSQEEYAALFKSKLEKRMAEAVQKRRNEGRGFLGKERMKTITPGSLPIKTKTSERETPRPRVLSKCPNRFAQNIGLYFQVFRNFREASDKYRAGDVSVKFPEGTYKPYVKTPINSG